MFIPSRREKRNETLRVSDLMSLRGTAASTTASVRGTHLMADECCFANSAPCAGPICGANSWPYGINLQLVPESKIDCISHGPRAVCGRAAGMVRRQCLTHRRSRAGLRQRFRRALHGTRRAESKTVSLSSRTYTDSDRREDRTMRSKTVWAKHGVPRSFDLTRKYT